MNPMDSPAAAPAVPQYDNTEKALATLGGFDRDRTPVLFLVGSVRPDAKACLGKLSESARKIRRLGYSVIALSDLVPMGGDANHLNPGDVVGVIDKFADACLDSTWD